MEINEKIGVNYTKISRNYLDELYQMLSVKQHQLSTFQSESLNEPIFTLKEIIENYLNLFRRSSF